MRGTITKIIIVVVGLLIAVWWAGKVGILKPQAVGAVLYLVAVDASFNAYSSINSSPWTYENMSGDGDKASSGSKYVWMANGAAVVLGAFATILAKSFWPLAGSVTVAALMHMLYRHAMSTGSKEGNTGWGSKGSSNGPASLTLVPAAGV